MKEMTQRENFIQGGSVKKTLFVAVLAAMLVICAAGSAFAGRQPLRPAALSVPRTRNVTRTRTPSAPVTYLQDWDTSLAGQLRPHGNSPHGNYTTTTVKCVVCHAVHYAAPGGAPVGSRSRPLTPCCA